ncbi:MAG: hypothetical protein ACRDE8_08380, partial [Ginsengibacter sp.]
ATLIIFSFLVLHKISFAQDTLPNISVTQLSKKILISWVNTLDAVTTINIQRSYDSLKNFTTIGSVLTVNAVNNGFVDSKEFNFPQYYRVFISFEGGTYMFTKSHKPVIDTVKNIAETKEKEPKEVTRKVRIPNIFIPSKLVYTGKENNVIISLPDTDKKKYSIKFFEANGAPLFEIKKITEAYLTLDKVNFVHAGLFNFEIYANGVLLEKHKLYIPKDGQPMPALDINGNELR